MPASQPRASRFWAAAFRAQYRLLRWIDPPVHAVWRRVGIGNTIELRVPGRRSGRTRAVLLGLLVSDGRWYLGHPNGAVAWTRNLDAAGGGQLVRHGQVTEVRAVPLEPGPERERAILATGQHPFPGNAIYRLARGHILAVGRYYRVEPRR
ncbi:MAG TPA: hypothetical protein VK592_06545 [Candidatus Dormibacteraeota bacterium]|nr:hypothetical protein [Candidatus Dormibacteraeota bacterium]